MTKYANDNFFYKTDTSSLQSNYNAVQGLIDSDSMFITTIPVNTSSQTFSDN